MNIIQYLRNLLAKDAVKTIDNEIEEYIKDVEETTSTNEKIIKIKRFRNPEIVDDETCKKAEKEFKEKILTEYMHCELLSEKEYKRKFTDAIKFLTIDLHNSCGKIVDIEDDYISITVNEEFKNGRLLLEILEKDKESIYAYGRYTSGVPFSYNGAGAKTVNRIIAFDIVYKR